MNALSIAGFRHAGLSAGLLLGVGCIGDFELPEPPDMTELSARYDAPTAELGPDTAEALLGRFLEKRERLADVDDLRVVTSGVTEFAANTSYGEDGTLEIDEVPVAADAVVTLIGICPGWEDGSEPGGFEVRLIVEASKLVPVAWGEIEDCRLMHTEEDIDLRMRLSATLSLYVPELAEPEAAVEDLSFLLAFSFFDVEILGEALVPWAGHFRLRQDLFEILIEDASEGSMVAFAGLDSGAIGVRAANGLFQCLPEERRCEDPQGSVSFSY